LKIFEDAAKAKGIEKCIQVKDIAELVNGAQDLVIPYCKDNNKGEKL
jgi:hypothetical protein